MAVAVNKHPLKIHVSPDRLKAFVEVRTESECRTLTYSDVVSVLELDQAKIKITELTKERISALIKMMQDGNVITEPFLVSEGTAPIDPTGETFQWDSKIKSDEHQAVDQEAVNFYERHKLALVETDAIIGQIIPEKPGKDGIDIYGLSIKPYKKAAKIKLGENVSFEPDGKTIRAKESGQVIFHDDKISVRKVLEIEGNVDFETGNIDAASDVLIQGSVCDLFVVKSKKNISIRGMVEAASLSADGNITIVGGIKGREKAILESKGKISARFMEFTFIEAGGDVEICKESIDSVILCQGYLDISNGALIGGQAYAIRGADIKSVGSPAGVRTIIGVGYDPFIFKQILDAEIKIKKNQEVIEKVKTSVEPLMKQLKRLTAEQREKATELMYKAQELEDENQKIEQNKNSLLNLFPQNSEIELRVGGRILPNTVVHVSDKFTTIREEIKGPIKIVLRKIEGVTELLLVNQSSGSIRTLICGRLDLDNITLPVKPHPPLPASKPQPPDSN